MSRIRFEIAWTINSDPVPGARHSFDDHRNHFDREFVRRFEGYRAAAVMEVIPQPRQGINERATLQIVWEVNLDPVPGAWAQSEDHVLRLTQELVDRFPHYRPELTVTHRPIGRALLAA